MATVLLQVAGSAIGGLLGGPMGAIAGRAVGGIAGYAVDQSLFAKDTLIEGARIDSSRFLNSGEGQAIPRVYGRARLGGHLIWATHFEEVRSTSTQSSGGKGSGPKVTTENFSYFANMAVGICEGEISHIGRIWADGVELDLTLYDIRIYKGSETQTADPLIEAKQGAGNTPAFKGTAYAVFEGFPLANYGNRIPQLTFEVIRSVSKVDKNLKSICVIPGSGEFVYSPTEITSSSKGNNLSENRHILSAKSDWKASMDELQAICPNLQSVALVVSWFGTDLRAGECKIEPRVEHKDTKRAAWQVSGLNRHAANLVSQIDGRPAYGGTPSDASVVDAIQDLKARGLKVLLYPFIMMDIPSDNLLADPYGAVQQQSYPWRGRITCDPAIGQAASADKTALATSQINDFIGSATYQNFSVSNNQILFSGNEISYSRMILHYAKLADFAGGVDAFLIGSELRGLSRVRNENNEFPFVSQLKTLAANARSILGINTKISYAADWSEYFGYHPQDGSGDLFYHLDPLWSDTNIDAVAIDNYMPLSDWNSANAQSETHINSIYNLDYLKSNIMGGEGYDWYYASAQDRENGVRTNITDGQNEPWVYRFKDLRSWWLNDHHERMNGVRSNTPTDWTAQSKPIWFTEAGCPAVDRGTNQPNVFYDPKSAESNLPYGSNGASDNLIQHRYMQAHLEYWQGEQSNFSNPNPISNIYNSPMVEVENIWFWTWDARPFPAFPLSQEVWSDGGNWNKGHWLNGRLGGCPVDDLITHIFRDYGYENVSIKANGFLEGYLIGSTVSLKSAVEPLSKFFNITVKEVGNDYVFLGKEYLEHQSLNQNDLVQEEDKAALKYQKTAEFDLPREVSVSHGSVLSNFDNEMSYSRRLETSSKRQMSITLPANLEKAVATAKANARLRDIWFARDTTSYVLPPKYLHLEAGDVIHFEGDVKNYQINSTSNALYAECSSVGFEIFEESAPATSLIGNSNIQASNFGKPLAVLMNLPLDQNNISPQPAIYAAIYAKPWQASYTIASSPLDAGFETKAIAFEPSNIFELLEPISSAPSGRWDYKNKLRVKTNGTQFQSIDKTLLFSGSNSLALETANGDWEIVQFLKASLIGTNEWELSSLLRGQLGTEFESEQGALAGANVVLLDQSLKRIEIEESEVGLDLNYAIGSSKLAFSQNTHVTSTFKCTRINARPLRPVHAKIELQSNDDILVSWMRRSRLNSDSWDIAETPLDESVERYNIDILDDQDVIVRTRISSTANYTYTAHDRLTDLGTLQANLKFKISQISDTGQLSPALIAHF